MINFAPEHGAVMGIGVVIGGIIGKVLTMRHEREKLRITEADEIRKELREDVGILQTKLDRLSTEMDTWKDRYYRLADENVQLRARCKGLEIEVADLKSRMPQAL